MFTGLLTLSPDLIPDQLVSSTEIGAALSPYRRPDREGVWQSGPLWLMAQRIFNAPESRDAQLPCRCLQTNIALAFWGRLDNRAELAQQLAISSEALHHLTDSQLTLAAWHLWGESLPEHLIGDFALAIMDAQQRKVFLARDAIGIKPLYYALNHQLLAFATSVAALRKVKALSLTPDMAWAARYLVGAASSRRETGYRAIVKLPPGHCLTVDSRGQEQLRKWSHFRDDAPEASKRDARWVDAYRTQLETAIRCRMSSNYPLGTENSGGLDSGTITSYLAHFLGEPGDQLHSFGFAISEPDPGLSLAICIELKIAHSHLVTASSAMASNEQDLTRALRVLGYPEENHNGSDHNLLYRECELHGIRTLFSGFGGDEVVTKWGGRLLRYEYLDAGHYKQLWEILPGNFLARSLRFGKIATLGRKKRDHIPEYLESWNARWPHQILRRDVVDRLRVHQAYMEGAKYEGPYRRINDCVLDFHLNTAPHIPTRLESCTLEAASYGVEFRWPLWDTRLIQQYLSTPSCEKVGPHGLGRYLHRRAVEGIVPSRVTDTPGPIVYPKIYQETKAKSLQAAASIGRELETGLHPALHDLIDRDKFRQQIVHAASGTQDEVFSYAFQQNVQAITRLNHWLYDAPAG